jgi:hypothetical protein
VAVYAHVLDQSSLVYGTVTDKEFLWRNMGILVMLGVVHLGFLLIILRSQLVPVQVTDSYASAVRQSKFFSEVMGLVEDLAAGRKDDVIVHTELSISRFFETKAAVESVVHDAVTQRLDRLDHLRRRPWNRWFRRWLKRVQAVSPGHGHQSRVHEQWRV